MKVMDTSLLIGLATGLCSAAVALAAFWLALGGRIGKAEASAASAIQVAAETAEDLKTAEERITTLNAQFSLYRETAIEKFVTYKAISEVEKRLADAINGMNERLDRLIEAGLRPLNAQHGRHGN